MSATLDELMREAESLSVEEKLRLAARLLEQASQTQGAPTRRRKWKEIRGMAYPSLLGEDAQAWITRTRRESDEQRERQFKRQP